MNNLPKTTIIVLVIASYRESNPTSRIAQQVKRREREGSSWSKAVAALSATWKSRSVSGEFAPDKRRYFFAASAAASETLDF
jgi:hypothetical protein